MQQYLNLLDDILYKGYKVEEDRTGTGTLKLFGTRMEFDLTQGFPLLTTKYIPYKLVLGELLWFIQGGRRDRNLYTQDLNKFHPSKIWNEWATDSGMLGPVYGVQWRSWPTFREEARRAVEGEDYPLIETTDHIDQLQNVINSIKTTPYSRRHIVSAWNVSELHQMRLAPCHILFQFSVRGKYLDCQLYQRSCDMFLGVPFNIASYSLLTMMVAGVCNLIPGRFIWVGGDTHIYLNHVDQVKLQLQRQPRKLPEIKMDVENNINDYKMDSFALQGYTSHPHIPAPISV
jgi:thymidylate synthase